MHFAVSNVSQKLKKSMLKCSLSRLAPVLILFIADRITKIYFLSHFKLGESKPLWNDFVRLSLVHNKGAAFGTMQEKGFLLITIFIIVSPYTPSI